MTMTVCYTCRKTNHAYADQCRHCGEPLTGEIHDLNFASASPLDDIVNGACRPGRYGPTPVCPEVVEGWARAMLERGIRRVVCLLADEQLARYERPLLEQLAPQFSSVVHAPIDDFDLPSEPVLARALAALRCAEQADEPVVVHCSAGMGRTGIVLTAWLVTRHGLDVEDAARIVTEHAAQRGATRDPWEVGREDVLGCLLRLSTPVNGA